MSSNPLPAPTLADAQHASLLFAQDQVKRINDQLTTRYNSNFDSWKTTVEAGTVPNTDPPSPPFGWVTFTQPDGFTYETRGYDPVCPARTDIPEDHTQPAVKEEGPVDVINVPPGDTKPTGEIVNGLQLLSMGANPAEIGTPASRWVKKERGGPFGVWRWYQRL